jgi:adenylyltransferase/sulfurtransferase
VDKEQRERYQRQTVFPPIGEAGQEKLLASKAAILGMGALGSVLAEKLARAGVGYLRLADRDYVELTNLQRQALYTEKDAAEGLPKPVAAAMHIAEINSGIVTDPVIVDINAGNIESLVADMDIVLDGSDNFELRALICEACHKHAVPWVYGGALGASGATMNILPEKGPCFRCITPDIPAPGSYPTCATAGVIGMITSVVASIQATEAIKILMGSDDVSDKYLSIDLWNNAIDSVTILKDENCPVCGKGEYAMLNAGASGDEVTPLCTPGSFQVAANAPADIDLEAFAERLSGIGLVMHNPYLLRFDGDAVSFNLFKDGRAVIRGAKDEAHARTIYSEYIGL